MRSEGERRVSSDGLHGNVIRYIIEIRGERRVSSDGLHGFMEM